MLNIHVRITDRLSRAYSITPILKMCLLWLKSLPDLSSTLVSRYKVYIDQPEEALHKTVTTIAFPLKDSRGVRPCQKGRELFKTNQQKMPICNPVFIVLISVVLQLRICVRGKLKWKVHWSVKHFFLLSFFLFASEFLFKIFHVTGLHHIFKMMLHRLLHLAVIARWNSEKEWCPTTL